MNKETIEKICKTDDNKALVMKAFQTDNVDKAIKILQKKMDHDEDEYYSDSDEDPLQYLTINSKFRSTRKSILKTDADNINSILTKVFDDYSDIDIGNIAMNQEIFLKIMSENIDNIETMPCDIDLNESDNEAIERIKTLGFPEHEVLQVYIAHNKDEQKTIQSLNKQ